MTQNAGTGGELRAKEFFDNLRAKGDPTYDLGIQKNIEKVLLKHIISG